MGSEEVTRRLKCKEVPTQMLINTRKHRASVHIKSYKVNLLQSVECASSILIQNLILISMTYPPEHVEQVHSLEPAHEM